MKYFTLRQTTKISTYIKQSCTRTVAQCAVLKFPYIFQMSECIDSPYWFMFMLLLFKFLLFKQKETHLIVLFVHIYKSVFQFSLIFKWYERFMVFILHLKHPKKKAVLLFASVWLGNWLFLISHPVLFMVFNHNHGNSVFICILLLFQAFAVLPAVINFLQFFSFFVLMLIFVSSRVVIYFKGFLTLILFQSYK